VCQAAPAGGLNLDDLLGLGMGTPTTAP